MPATVSTKPRCCNCRAETFTATLTGGSPRARQVITWLQASRSTQAPAGTISPVSSSTGMNWSGITIGLPSGCQRSSASTPVTTPVTVCTLGW